ncbi:MAG: autotransporter domain-containing protein, partial [Novosphingobium sp.]|nr:autotransporter domain-containing protein [Novosphingobium sp.]
KEGAGTLILSADNTYTGDTYVNEGTLQLGNGGPAGSIAAVSEVKLLAGTTLAFNRSDEPVFVGNRITGAGSVEQIGSGVIVLTNENDYSGGTRVLNGTLQLGSATYGHGSIIGAVTTEGGSLWIANSNTTGITTIDNNNGGSTRFFISQNADKIEITNNAGGLTEFNNDSSAGQATIKNNSGETDFYDRSTAGSAEIFNDGGGLIYFFDKSTAGSARITNSNQSYTLFVSAPPNSGGTPSAGNATIINETGGITFFGASSGAGNATIINNDGSATGFFEDSSAGNAAITNKAGGQTGFFGNSTADAATITNKAGSVTYFSGNSTAGSAVLVNQGDSLFDFSGTTGPGGLGQVSAGSIAGEGTFALGANRLTVGGNGDSTTVSGVITDGGLYGGAGGSIVKTGSGTLTLGGINAYTGGTTIGNGKLVATNGNALGSGAIVNDAALVLDFANDGTLTGALSGAGSLTKTGAGIATLSADNSSQGDVTVEAGALRFEQTGTFTAKSYETQGGAATTVGAHAQLIVTNGFTTAGIVDNEGTIKGALTQSAGTTTNNGGITGLATIDGGLFTGIGSAGGLKVAGGAIVAPGIDGGIGAMRVDGDVAFAAGSIYRVAINGAGDGSRIDAGGKAVIDGGTVDVRAGSGNYAPATSYVILTAEDGRTGEFTGVTSDLTFLSLFLAYDANTVILTTVRNDISFADVGDTPNQIATGGGAEGLGHGNPVWDALVQLDAPGARAAFDQLSGEIHASARTALIEDSRFVREAALDRLRTAGEDAGEDGRAAAWGRAFGSWGRTGSDGNAARLSRSTGGFVMGVDAGLSETVRAGLLGGYSHTSFDSARGQGDSDNYHLGAYAGGRWGAVSLRAGAARTWHRLLTARRVTFPNFADSLTAHYKANTTQVFGEAGYSITGKAVTLEPFAGIAYVDLHTDGFAEKGGAAALTARGGNTAITFSTLGLRGSTGFGADGIKAEAMLGWRHAFGDVVPRSAMAFAGGDEFTVAGVPLARNVAAIEAGLTMPIGSKAGIGVSYSGQFGSGVTDNGVRANFRLQF